MKKYRAWEVLQSRLTAHLTSPPFRYTCQAFQFVEKQKVYTGNTGSQRLYSEFSILNWSNQKKKKAFYKKTVDC